MESPTFGFHRLGNYQTRGVGCGFHTIFFGPVSQGRGLVGRSFLCWVWEEGKKAMIGRDCVNGGGLLDAVCRDGEG